MATKILKRKNYKFIENYYNEYCNMILNFIDKNNNQSSKDLKNNFEIKYLPISFNDNLLSGVNK